MSGEPAAPAPEPSATAAPTPELQPSAPAPADGGAPPADANAPEPAPAETVEEQNKKRERFDRRFSDLTNRARDAELRAARAEGEAAALRALQRPAEPQAQQPSAPAAPPPAPDPKSYPGGKFDEKYIEDLVDWKAKRAAENLLSERDEAAKAAQRDAETQAAINAGRDRLERTLDAASTEASGANGEYFQNATRVLELAFVPQAEGGLPRHVVDLITESENPVHVAEYLGRQPNLLREIRALPALKAAKQIGVLDAAISANLKRQNSGAGHDRQQPRPAPTPSPAPMPVVQPTGAAPSFDPNKGSMDDYVRWREAQQAQPAPRA